MKQKNEKKGGGEISPTPNSNPQVNKCSKLWL